MSSAPRTIALIAGALFLAFGVWAFAAPESFFDSVATYEPYNRHSLQDVGAFQIGLGAVLVLGARPGLTDGLTVTLLGVGIGSAVHTVSHISGRNLGGNPAFDIPALTVLTLLLLGSGWARGRELHAGDSSRG